MSNVQGEIILRFVCIIEKKVYNKKKENVMEQKEPMQSHYFDCQCSSPEHTLRFVYDSEYNELYTEIFLCQNRNIFQRIWVAIKYIFGFKCRYGHWDCWLLRQEDCSQLLLLVDKVCENYKRTENEQEMAKT